eukprot:2990393-Amphidinium_carterae.1
MQQRLKRLRLPFVGKTIRGDRTYVIVGASGGLAGLVKQWLHAEGAGRIVLASRSESGDAADRTEWVKTDVAQEEAVKNLLSKASSDSMFPLGGVFHLAGCLKDAPLMRQTAQSLQDVWAPKAR